MRDRRNQVETNNGHVRDFESLQIDFGTDKQTLVMRVKLPSQSEWHSLKCSEDLHNYSDDIREAVSQILARAEKDLDQRLADVELPKAAKKDGT